MANAPCAFCARQFLGRAWNIYHGWNDGASRVSYLQKSCPKCLESKLQPYLDLTIENDNEPMEVPEKCPGCNKALGDDWAPTYSTLFRGQERDNRVSVLCAKCLGKWRPTLMQGASRRDGDGSSGGGAPTRDPQGPSIDYIGGSKRW